MSQEDLDNKANQTGLEIAVIGMAGRFPGAKNIDEFWNNLKNGVESIAFFTEHELEEAGVKPGLLKKLGYVKANGILEDILYFDSNFFGYTPREADLMDPQQRVFHECTWIALEDAGYSPGNYDGLIGLYAGATSNFWWEARAQLSGKANEMGQYAASQLMNKDFLSVRISYKLNLKGPAVIIQSACSTSLVAIHMACQAILNGECDIALAGGVTVSVLEKSGYLYQDGMILSPDGHCRAFDANAQGIVGGNGVGIVVLKRLDEAMTDGDHIYALVKGSAINNDGLRKIGFTAPSIDGEAEVIMAAHEVAEVEPESISFIETHGTGTALGDPVEIQALTMAFNTDKKGFCAVGSVKTNIGHLDAAAGAAGFIKTALALKHRLIPPSLHFKSPNPKIDFENSPFYVNTGLKEWTNDTYPLRAGVSSFGMGGTNAHVILEEAPVIGHSSLVIGETVGYQQYQLILLSAKTQAALDKMTENLGEYFKKNPLNPGNHEKPTNPGPTLADAAYTSQVGRQAFQHRRMAVAANVDEVIHILSSPGSGKLHTFFLEEQNENPPVIFMFPGQGAQYVNMGRDLYEKEIIFREEMDHCFEILDSLVDYDIKEILYPGDLICKGGLPYPPNPVNSPLERGAPEGRGVSNNINQTEIAQPLLFTIEYALAKLLMAWGIKPYAMIGHSIGEYVAACLSGVFSPADALRLVVMRGKLMQQAAPGAMLSVSVPEQELLPLLEPLPSLSLAAVNSSSLCTVSGPHETIETLARELEHKGHSCRRLHTSHAFHSSMMDPILEEFAREVKQVRLNKPELPYISNVTGEWIGIEEAVDPRYWAAHIRSTVHFARGLDLLLNEDNPVFIEVGPGQNLSTFVRKHTREKTRHLAINLIKHPQETMSDCYYLVNQLGRLWLHGQAIDWQAFHPGKRQRISLPVYPFEGRFYSLSQGTSMLKEGKKRVEESSLRYKKEDISQWFYLPLWKQSPSPSPYSHYPVKPLNPCTWLVFTDQQGLAARVAKQLQQQGHQVILVEAGLEYKPTGMNRYTIDPRRPGDYDLLLDHLRTGKHNIPSRVAHFWGVTGNRDKTGEVEPGIMEFYSLLYLAQAMGKQTIAETVRIAVITDNMQAVTGEEELDPAKAVVLGPVKVIPREYHFIDCCSIDIVLPPRGSAQEEQLPDRLAAELTKPSPQQIIAYRGKHRWIQTFEPVNMEEPPKISLRLKQGGVYLVTGGLGGIGLVLAEYLAKSVGARLVLTGRSAFPPGNQWQSWLDTHPPHHPVSCKIQKLRELENLGAQLLVTSANVADEEQMQAVIAQARQRFGKINGVIHAAGIPDGAIIQQRTPESFAQVLAPKVNGTLVLNRLLDREKEEPDFLVLCSSLSSILAPVGQVAYCAANAFLDAFSQYRNSRDNGKQTRGTIVSSINWDTWQEVGMAVAAAQQQPAGTRTTIDYESALKNGLTSAEGVEVFKRILAAGWSSAAVCTRDLHLLLEAEGTPGKPLWEQETPPHTTSIPTQNRPGLSTPYVAPRDKIEQQLAETWQNFLVMDKVGIHDNFFELGASSLDIVQVNRKLENLFNRQIPVATLFTYPTIDTLKKYLDQEDGTTAFSREEAARLEKISSKQKNKLKQRKKSVMGEELQNE